MLRKRLIDRLSPERGLALPLAIGITVVLGILVMSVADYTSLNLRSASDSNQRNIAYAAAEAGLNDALSWLHNNPSQWHSTTAYSQSNVSVGSNGATYSYTATPNDPIWTIVSTGQAPNKTQGSKPDTRTVKRTVKITAAAGAGVDTSVWNYIYSDAPPSSPCMNLANNSAIATPFYVRGNLCLGNNAHIDRNNTFSASFPNLPQLQVGGYISLGSGNTHVGASNSHLNGVQTPVGCGNPSSHPCTGAGDNVWADSYPTAAPNLSKPVIDLATWYKDAAPGPKHNCTSGSFPGGFDTNGAQDNSLGTVNLTPASAYDCKFVDATGAMLGEIKWTPGSGHPGTLYVNGTLFWDGNLHNTQDAVYYGRSTLYFAGTINLSTNLCGSNVNGAPSFSGQGSWVSCSSPGWDSTDNLMVLVAGSNAQSPSYAFDISSNNGNQFQGASEANGDFHEANNVGVWGAVIAHQIYISNNAQDQYVPFGTPVPGQPAQGGYSETLTFPPNSFSG